MSKTVKIGALLAVAAAITLGVVGVAYAQAEDPTPETPPFFGHGGWGLGIGRGGGLFWGGGPWEVFDAAAEALGLTPEDLFSQLHSGKTLEEVAEAHGVDGEDVQEAMEAVRSEARTKAIEQAVEEGDLSREQADWMLEGIRKGYAPMRRGFHRFGCPNGAPSSE